MHLLSSGQWGPSLIYLHVELKQRLFSWLIITLGAAASCQTSPSSAPFAIIQHLCCTAAYCHNSCLIFALSLVSQQWAEGTGWLGPLGDLAWPCQRVYRPSNGTDGAFLGFSGGEAVGTRYEE